MKKEKCSNCQNIVIGVFTPSETRKWLTALAKKGGMKAVLAAAGSVIPGFGNISGFLAGTAIDLIYGKDINKLIDEIADLYDDNKIYVFTCPNCGHTWSRIIDENDYETTSAYLTMATSIGEATSISITEPESGDDIAETFNKNFNRFLKEIDNAIEDENSTRKLCNQMASFGADCQDKILSSQYYYLAGLGYLLRAKEFIFSQDVNVTQELENAKLYLSNANGIYPDKEYQLILAAANTLSTDSPEECIEEGTIETSYFKFDYPTLFKEDWLVSIYETCRFFSIVRADDILTDEEDDDDDLDDWINLWKSGLNLKNPDYRMVCNINLFELLEDEVHASGRYSARTAEALNDAFDTEGYDIESIDPNNFYASNWAKACVYFAKSIIEDKNPFVRQDIERGLTILWRIADLDTCYAKEIACEALGEYYEEGVVVEKDISKALTYYKRGGSEENILRLLQQSFSKQSVSKIISSARTTDEDEYVEEVKACLEDGEITKGTRRLLEKLRVKLGISENRAQELETSLLPPCLTEEEQEYLAEFRECFADGGMISVGERRLLNRLRMKLGISESRAAELENL